MLRYFLFLLVICPLQVQAQGPDSLWEPLPIPFDFQINELYGDTMTGDLYLTSFGSFVGSDTSSLVRWDGQQATLMRPPLGDGHGLMRFKNKLMIGGLSDIVPGPKMLMAYDGQSWMGLDSSQDWTFVPRAVIDDKLVITGYFDAISGHPIKDAAMWDGNGGWRDFYRFDTISLNREVILSVVKYKGEVYAAGTIYARNNMTHIARFDGKNWKDVGGGVPAGGMGGVNCMLVWRNELYVAGQFLEQTGAPGNSIAKWDGQKWHRLGNGITQGGTLAAIYDIEVYHDNLYVVGVFSEADGVPVNNIAKWDGSRWCSLNTDFGIGTPSQIEVAKDELYISGEIKTLNGKTMHHVARWTGGDYAYQCGPVRMEVKEPYAKSINALVVTPNPSSGVFDVHYRTSSNEADARIRVVNSLGQLLEVRSSPIVNGQASFILDLVGLPTGWYILNVNGESTSLMKQ